MIRQQDNNGKRSLQDIMNMMAQRDEGCAPAGRKRGVISEAEAYAAGDPLLAELLKEYRDSHGRYEKLLRKNGAADPMVDVAADMAGSADTAVQTRLIELRACKHARQMAEQRMEENAEMMNASTRYHEKMKAHILQVEDAALQARREAARESFLWMMMLWWMLQQAMIETQRRLSMAQDFAVVSSGGERYVAA